MPSPACEVKDGSGAYSATTNGVNVTPGNTITIHLVSSAGVNTWSISCITTDDQSDAATVTAALTIDSVAKTATFTAPVAGRAYRFQSKVNGGIGPDGTAQSSYTTTFGVYTLTSGGLRVHAVDETFESDSTFGWIGDINSVIRNPSSSSTPTGTGFRHVTANVEDGAAKLVVNTDVDAAAAIALSKLAAGGTNEQVVKQSAGALALGSINLASSVAVGSSKLAPANGGTGQDFSASTGVAKFAAGTASVATVVNADVDAAAAIAGTKISPDFGSQNISTTGAATLGTYVAVGASPSASGGVRLPNNYGVYAKTSGGVDHRLVSISSGDLLEIGNYAAGSADVNIYTSNAGSVQFQTQSYNILGLSASLASFAVPVAGYATASMPYRKKSTTITQSSTSDTTLNAGQYSCPIIKVSGTPGGDFNIIGPNNADAVFWVKNDTANNLTFKVSGQTGVVFSTGAAGMVWHNGTDYEKLSTVVAG